MGNRAVITQSENPNAPAIYLHWNGGEASIAGFLHAAKQVGLDGRDPLFIDKFADLIARRFFGNAVGFTVYREPYKNTDKNNGDNGVYIIDQNLMIIGRLYNSGFAERDPDKTCAIAKEIIANLLPRTDLVEN